MVFTDNGVNLPVTQAGFFTDYARPVINTDTVPDLPPLVLRPVLPAFLATVPKMLVERATLQLVRPDMLINPLMADRCALLPF